MSRALYRRYRSKSFQDVVGQEHVTALLQEAVNKSAISHAYLFTGPRGVGKTSVARILAHAINELPYTEAPHLDIIEIDAASNRRIDDVRDLREKVHISPTSAQYKVYIIDEVHMLTGESFNALLKTLEEPPSHVIFILATTEIHKVPATIISRTQRFHFRPGNVTDITKHLSQVAKKEKISIDESSLELIAKHSEGSFRDALSLLDQAASSKTDKTITVSDIEALFGIAPLDSIDALVKTVIDGDMKSATAQLKELYDRGISPVTIANQLAHSIADNYHDQAQLFSLIDELLDIQRSTLPELKLLAAIGKATWANKTTESKPASAAATAQPAKTIASKPITERPKKSEPNAKTNTKITDQDIPEISPQASKDLHWDEVLENVQKRAPALYSVLKRAQVECSNEEIVLSFQYSLHRKKMNDSKYRQQLVSLIENTFGHKPELSIIDGQTAASDPTLDTVASIMGGGKPVNV